jgi:acyl-CoA thioester hydrolase
VSDFRIDLRVRFAETDAMGVAHHAAYLPYLETARVEYLRWLGHPYRELRDRDGIEFAVVGVDLRYHAPLRFDDAFTVSCALVERARATFRLAYRVELDGRLVLDGRTRHAVLDRETGAPRRVPGWLAVIPVDAVP